MDTWINMDSDILDSTVGLYLFGILQRRFPISQTPSYQSPVSEHIRIRRGLLNFGRKCLLCNLQKAAVPRFDCSVADAHEG